MKNESLKEVCEGTHENISNSVILIMKTLQKIRNTKRVIDENEDYIENAQYRQIA